MNIKDMTFIKIGKRNPNIMVFPDKINTNELIKTFADEYGYTDIETVYDEDDTTLQIFMTSDKEDSLNKMFVFWLNRQGWYDLDKRITRVNLIIKR